MYLLICAKKHRKDQPAIDEVTCLWGAGNGEERSKLGGWGNTSLNILLSTGLILETMLMLHLLKK